MKNLNVGYKLGLGFGVILLLCLVLVISNAIALRNINRIAENVVSVNEVRFLSETLEILTLEYTETVEESLVDEVKSLIQEIENETRKIEQNAKDSNVLASNQQAIHYLKDFSTIFQAYAALVYEKEELVEKATVIGARSDRMIAALHNTYNGAPGQTFVHESDRSAQTGRYISDLAYARLYLSYAARIYLYDPNEQGMKGLADAYTQIDTLYQTIRPRLQGSHLNSLEQAMQGIADYKQQTDRLLRMNSELQGLFTDLTDSLENLEQAANMAGELQTQLRVRETALARMVGIILGVVALGLGIFIAFIITRSVLTPLRSAVGLAQAIGNRDLTAVSLESRRDEFGSLLNALEATRKNLAEAMSDVQGITEQLSTAAEELSAVTEQTSAGVQSQRIESEQVATAINEMSTTIHEVARNAEEAAAAALEADNQAQSGEKSLQAALSEVVRLVEDMNQTADVMTKLNEESNNISTVLTVINGIAEQTNLLALNAAIEAARAGDSGRGFAVVADEVRNLAQRTQESTAEIENLIGNLQQGSQQAVARMDTSKELANSTLSLSEQAGDELKAITASVASIEMMNSQIATAVEEQSSVVEDINRSITNVSEIADQSAAAAEETAASSSELAQLSQSLRDLVERFKVN